MDSNGRGLWGQVAQVWRALGVNESPLLRDMQRPERTRGGERLAAVSLLAGLLAALVIAWRIGTGAEGLMIIAAVGIIVMVPALVALASRGQAGRLAMGWLWLLLASLAGLTGGTIVIIMLAIVAIVVFIACGVDPNVMQSAIKLIQSPNFKPGYWPMLALVWTLAITNGAMMLTFVWLASLVGRKPLKLSFTTARRWRWRQLAGGLVLYGAALGVMQLVEIIFFGQKAALPVFALSPSLPMGLLFVALAMVGLTLAAGAEELVFRGWLLRNAAGLTRWTWVFLLINGVLFSAVHGDFDPNAFIARAAMGVGFSYMALRMGGIEFSTGAHTANNLLIVLFIEPLTLVTPPPMPFDPGSLVETSVMFILIIAVTEIAIRVPFLAALIGPPSPGADPGAANEAFS